MISVPMPMMQVPMTAVPLIGYQTAMLVPVLVVNQPIMEHTALPSMDSNSSFSSESSESISRQCSEQSRESTDSDLGDDGVSGRVWELSQKAKGCRMVQTALDAADDVERLHLAEELRQHIASASKSACANYVLQRVIQLLRPQACQFIIDELLEDPEEVSSLAKHQYGCRILQRLLENCSAHQMQGIVRLLLSEPMALVQHPYGTFVVQQMLDFGSHETRLQLGQVLLRSLAALGGDESGTQVLQRALQHCPQKVALAQGLMSQFPQIAKGRHSHQTVIAAMQLLPQEDSEKAVDLLSRKVQKLWASRYGRLVVKSIPSLHQKCSGMTRREAASA